jgi:hypothetical protein
VLADRSIRSVQPNDEPFSVAAFVAMLDHTNGTLLYAGAGREIAFVIQPDGVHKILPATGPALGSWARPRFNARRIALRPGETLVATTAADGAFVSEIVRTARVALEDHADPSLAVIEAVGRFGLSRVPDGYATVVTTLGTRSAA